MSLGARDSIAFGIDIGGSGTKCGLVNLRSGQLTTDRVRVPTPVPATPVTVAETVGALAASFELPSGLPVGVTFPAVVQHGVARTAANVDESWIGTDINAVLSEATGHPVLSVNDADAAGYAETRYGAAHGQGGIVVVITLGAGIGSCLVVDGMLVPNTELGHLQIDGMDAERRAADSVREREDLDWPEWAGRLQRYFRVVEDLLWPDLIVVGGGVSKQHELFLPLLDLRTPIVPATLRNTAGIVGAAALAAGGIVLD